MFSERAGLASAAVYALSPVVIAYSRSSWNPNIVPFFAMLLIYVLWRIAGSGKMKTVIASGIILGIGIQLHYLFSFLFLFTGIWLLLLILYKKMHWLKTVASVIIGFIVGNSLFLLFEVRHGFPNTISIVNFILEGKDTGFSAVIFFNNIISVAYRLFGRLVLRLPDYNVLEKIPPFLEILWILSVYVLLISGIGFCLIFLIRNKTGLYSGLKEKFEKDLTRYQSETVGVLLLLSWFFIVIISFGSYRRNIYDYYLGIIFPLPFIITGFLLDKLYVKLPTKFVAIIVFVSLIILNWQGRPFRFQPNNQLAQARNIAGVVFDIAGNKPFNFALLAGQNTDHSYRYFLEIWGNPPVVIENTAIDPERKSVTGQLIVICEEIGCKPLGHPLWEIAGFGRAEISGEWAVSFVKIYKLIHYQGT
jgi:4-amino-4-deoxy-L-arabinose transferase-like glycosyltransferase